ncbi:MAG TPA: TolC family protein [Verrucomicrobiae bacterium]|nr:TolC family protein [Verrucomicrobiae bacterium]
MPLLNRNAGPIAEAKARRAAAAARFMALQSKVIGEIDRAVAVLDASRTNMVALQSLLDAQAAQQRSVEAQFKAGAADQLELLGARVQFNTASLTVLDARLKLQQAMSDLEDAVQRPLYPQNGENQ